MTDASEIRIKHSNGLGGWVVYVGFEFVGGAFRDRDDAEQFARRLDVVAGAEAILSGGPQ